VSRPLGGPGNREDKGARQGEDVDVENITNLVYVIAREGEFAAAQYSSPRLLSVTVKVSY
jgi:hypothetical protein